jgi:DNA polymerase III gamma/tau subunit
MLHIKYRPTDFDEFLGNASTVQVLEKELSKEKPIHAYLFTGPPGCGKTTLGRIVAKRLGCKGNDFREIDSADFRGIDTVREIRKQSQFLAMEGERKVWLLDECFAKGTQITMKNGSTAPIETVKIGDEILNLFGSARVRNIFRNKVPLDRVVRVVTGRGSAFCSKDHLFLTEQGWKKAIDLSKKNLTFSLCSNIMDSKTLLQGERNEKNYIPNEKTLSPMWNRVKTVTEEVLQQLMPIYRMCPTCGSGGAGLFNLQSKIPSKMVRSKTDLFHRLWEYFGRTETEGAREKCGMSKKDIRIKAESKNKQTRAIPAILSDYFGPNEKEQPRAQSGCGTKNYKYEKDKWNPSYMERGTRREWKTNPASNYLSNCIKLGNRILRSYWVFPNQRGKIPYELQSGHRPSRSEISNRNRWNGTSLEKNEVLRSKKDGQIDFVRVESVEIYQRGSNERCFQSAITDTERSQGFVTFYDLEIEGHPSYYANRMLVHNCHKLSNDAMNALLKALEDPPDHVYYVLCTTDPQKLIETVKDRCQQLKVGPLSDAEMKKLIRTVVKAEGESLQKNIYDQICQDSQGRPRAALQILTKVLCVPAESRLEVAQKAAEEQSQVIELCRALMSASGWKKIANILVGLKNQDPETIRRGVLGYCQAILLKGEENDQAAAIMEEMLTPFYSSGFPELTFACYSIMHPPSNEDGIPF